MQPNMLVQALTRYAIKKFRLKGNTTHQDIVRVVQGRLLVIKGREAHALEVPPVALLPPHHDPHAAPLRQVQRLDDPAGAAMQAFSCDTQLATCAGEPYLS